jgi:hypothetical protein
MAMLEKSLGSQCTPEVKEAWEESYRKAAASMMEHGAQSGEPSF